MFTVIGFTKFKGFLSLKGKLNSPFGSSLGQGIFFSTRTGSYWPGPIWIVGSTWTWAGSAANRSDFETKPFRSPRPLSLSFAFYSSIGTTSWYAPGPGSRLKYSFNSILASNLLCFVPNYYSYFIFVLAGANEEKEVSVARLDVPTSEPLGLVWLLDCPLLKHRLAAALAEKGYFLLISTL